MQLSLKILPAVVYAVFIDLLPDGIFSKYSKLQVLC